VVNRHILNERMDAGRFFFLPMPGDAQWKKCYVVEYLRPCLPEEIPTDQEDAEDAKVNTSAETNQEFVFSLHSKTKYMLINSNNINIRKNSTTNKGRWHMVQFWGNDYSKVNSLPRNSPLFFPCFTSVNDRVNGNPRLLFTNAREKKVPYTGKVQDRDFQVGTEVFDDGNQYHDHGMRMTQESWERVLGLANHYHKKISLNCLE